MEHFFSRKCIYAKWAKTAYVIASLAGLVWGILGFIVWRPVHVSPQMWFFLVHIKDFANARSLLADRRQWRRSGLKADMGDLDLIAILKEFHVQMIKSYAVFVAKTFFPELHPASDFYAQLTKEVHERDANARMIFFSEKPEFAPGEGGKVSVNMKIIFVPNDVFAELGIKVERA